ncbi:hypothetical protein EV129_113127 [Rhizobium azibense]|uniref:Uncharacterized protein n=1 Tax=Rhizobium azibense TaxID=1136135 RepID=A0A4R3RKI2_9HYPH|nr:hypothetical protein EV129_113127 [Rhizobium azibense]
MSFGSAGLGSVGFGAKVGAALAKGGGVPVGYTLLFARNPSTGNYEPVMARNSLTGNYELVVTRMAA